MTERLDKPRPGVSLSARMMLWYALSAFALVLATTGILYHALAVGLVQEDGVLLRQTLQSLGRQLGGPEGLDDLREAVRVQAALPGGPWLWIRLTDAKGRVQAETPGMSQVLPPALFPSPAQEGAVTRGPVTVISAEGHPFRGEAAVIRGEALGGAGSLQVAVDAVSDEAILGKFRARLWIVLALSLLASAAIGYAIARHGIAPLRSMALTASRIGSSTLHERLVREGLPAELDQLAATFNTVLEGLEESFARLSRFSADIAHELRTPLQNLRMETEVGLRRDRSPGENQELLGSFLEEYQRLSVLIDRLLFLAQTEHPSTQIRREEVDLARELALLVEFYAPAASEAHLELIVEGGSAVPAKVDRTLFQRAVGNLVENAMKHTPEGGRISLKAEGHPGGATVEVADTGEGLGAEAVARAFERFYRSDPARARGSGGMGLGLAIVKGIMTLHGGTAILESRPDAGTRVILRFPG